MATPREVHPVTFFKKDQKDPNVKDFTPKRIPADAVDEADTSERGSDGD